MPLTSTANLGNFRLAAGEAFVVQMLVDEGEGADERAFVMSVYDPEREIVDTINGVENDDLFEFIRPGTWSEGLYGKTGLKIEIAERLKDGRAVIASPSLTVEVSAATVADYTNSVIARTAVLITASFTPKGLVVASADTVKYDPGSSSTPGASFTQQPTVSPSSGSVGQIFTATAGVATVPIDRREWRSGGSVIGTSLASPPAPEGALSYQEFAGSASSDIRTVTVAAAQVPAGFPTGAVMSLYPEDATTYNVVKNRAEPAALPVSIWGEPRPTLNPLVRSDITNNMTVTPGATGEDAAAFAYRLQWAAGASSPLAFLGGIDSSSFPGARVVGAGTYTLALRAKAAAATTMTLQDGGGAFSSSKNITTSWSDYSVTFTVGAEAVINLQIAGGATAGDVVVDFIRIEPGSVAAAAPATNRHLVKIGKFAKSGQVIRTQPSSSGAHGAEPYAYMLRNGADADATVNEISFVAAIRIDDGVDMAGVYPVIGERPSGGELNANDGIELLQSVGQFGLTGKLTGSSLLVTTAGLDKAGWVTVIGTGSVAGGVNLYVDGICVGSTPAAYGGGVFSAYALFGRAYQFAFPGKFAFIGLWERAFSASEVVQAHTAAGLRISDLSEAYSPPAQAVIAEGDSITEGTGSVLPAGSYVAQAARSFTKRAQIRNFGKASAVLGAPGDAAGTNSLWGRSAEVAAHIAKVVALGRQPVVSVMIGINDGGRINADPVAYAQAVEDYWTFLKSAGAKVVGATFMADNENTGPQNTIYETCRQSLRSRASAGKCDGFADYAAGGMVPWNGTNYQDRVHPTPAGHALMAPVLKAALSPLMPDRS